MKCVVVFYGILLLLLFAFVHQCNGKIKVKHIIQVEGIKQFKKLLKTHTNVLTIFSKDDKSALPLIRWMETVAKDIKGKGTFLYVNCGETKDAKKMCKKLDVKPKPTLLKHYKDGSFNKDYDRKDTAKSMLNFMLDPTGDAPWEEDPASENVVHVHTEKDLIKLRRKEKGPMLIMFYAPWCGYCKKLKPDFVSAANELKGSAVLVGMNVDKPETQNVRYEFNITGFPTIVYFEKGEKKFNYGGDMSKDGIVSWMGNPTEKVETKDDEEESWVDEAPEILHLKDATFEESLTTNPSMLVMFYAPWCGHCKKMKPEYVSAAKQMKEEGIEGTLAAVDCTIEKAVCKKYDISGYPTVKYFAGEYKFKVSVRDKDKIIEFMKKPEAPPPPPPEDLPWPEVSGPEILHLEDSTFVDVLKKKKHVLVMFYAPWCGHCKKAKPEIQAAAEHYKDDRKVWFAGVDCTIHNKICSQFDVEGYPTFRYFLYGKNDFKYKGGRSKQGFIDFMKDPQEKTASSEAEPPQWKDTPSGVVHLEDADFDDYIKSQKSVLVMFYAPWCGHCKSMKPAYTEAANELLGQDHRLAAVDCTKNRRTASKYDINGYPTLKYFNNGEVKEYEGGRSKSALIQYVTGKQGERSRPKDKSWADEPSEVHHLTGSNFRDFLKDKDALVMFYAPWCGHCKAMKPAYMEAAKNLNDENFPGKLAALDATLASEVSREEGVTGYPTLRYYSNGKFVTKFEEQRSAENIQAFMKKQFEPAGSVDMESKWKDVPGLVKHVTKDNFSTLLASNTHVLVAFYIKWCKNCLIMRDEFTKTASKLPETLVIAAIDCDANKEQCDSQGVKTFPTMKYYKAGVFNENYSGKIDTDSVLNYMLSKGKEGKEEL